MSKATLKRLKTHDVGPDRQEVIAEICDCLDEGDEMWAEYQCPRPCGPVTVIISERPPSKQEWRLDGLSPAECDAIRSHQPADITTTAAPSRAREIAVVYCANIISHQPTDIRITADRTS